MKELVLLKFNFVDCQLIGVSYRRTGYSKAVYRLKLLPLQRGGRGKLQLWSFLFNLESALPKRVTSPPNSWGFYDCGAWGWGPRDSCNFLSLPRPFALEASWVLGNLFLSFQEGMFRLGESSCMKHRCRTYFVVVVKQMSREINPMAWYTVSV